MPNYAEVERSNPNDEEQETITGINMDGNEDVNEDDADADADAGDEHGKDGVDDAKVWRERPGWDGGKAACCWASNGPRPMQTLYPTVSLESLFPISAPKLPSRAWALAVAKMCC